MAYLDTDLPLMNGGGSSSGFGNGNDAWVLIILFALIFGWGRNGFGNGGGATYDVNADLQRGFDTQGINAKLNSVGSGICDSTYALNNTMTNGFANIQNSLCQGFNGVNVGIMQNGYDTRSAITNLGYQMLDSFNGISSAIANCCCNLEKSNMENRFAMSQQTCDIIRASQDNTQRIIDMLSANKVEELSRRLLQAENQLSQNAQTATIINALRTTPTTTTTS